MLNKVQKNMSRLNATFTQKSHTKQRDSEKIPSRHNKSAKKRLQCNKIQYYMYYDKFAPKRIKSIYELS